HGGVRARPATRRRSAGAGGLLVRRGLVAMISSQCREPSVLVLRALGIGDLLTAVPALRALRRAFPGERLVLAAPGELADIVGLVDAVDELLPTSGLGALRWSGPPPRLAVNLHGCGPESIRDLLATRPQSLLTHHHPAFP